MFFVALPIVPDIEYEDEPKPGDGAIVAMEGGDAASVASSGTAASTATTAPGAKKEKTKRRKKKKKGGNFEALQTCCRHIGKMWWCFLFGVSFGRCLVMWYDQDNGGLDARGPDWAALMAVCGYFAQATLVSLLFVVLILVKVTRASMPELKVRCLFSLRRPNAHPLAPSPLRSCSPGTAYSSPCRPCGCWPCSCS